MELGFLIFFRGNFNLKVKQQNSNHNSFASWSHDRTSWANEWSL